MCKLTMTSQDGGLYRNANTEAPLLEVFVGIDQSYTGYAITAISKEDGSFYTWLGKTPAVCEPLDRLLLLREFIETVFKKLNSARFFASAVAMEGYAYSSTMGHMAGELGGMTKLCLWDNYGIRPTLVAPAKLKKYITGKGTGVKKNQILLHVFKKWDAEFTDDNMADSYGLARIAAGMSDVAYEKDIIDSLAP